MRDPWHHFLEYSIWIVLVAVLAMAAFMMREAWAPLAYPARLVASFYAVMFSGIAPGESAGRATELVFVTVCTWVWLALPLWPAVRIVQWIRRGRERSSRPASGLTFWQAFPAYVVAIALSVAWVAVIMAHSGFMRYAYDAEEGIIFALLTLPIAIMPLTLMTLRHAIPAAWRRFNGPHS